MLAAGDLGDDDRGVLAAFAEMPAQPDAEPAMRALVGTGVSQACFSNGQPRSQIEETRRLVEAHIEPIVSAEEGEDAAEDRPNDALRRRVEEGR